jgi:hypothetical protein
MRIKNRIIAGVLALVLVGIGSVSNASATCTTTPSMPNAQCYAEAQSINSAPNGQFAFCERSIYTPGYSHLVICW